MAGMKERDHHERQPAVRRSVREKFLERFETARGSAQRHDEKLCSTSWLRGRTGQNGFGFFWKCDAASGSGAASGKFSHFLVSLHDFSFLTANARLCKRRFPGPLTGPVTDGGAALRRFHAGTGVPPALLCQPSKSSPQSPAAGGELAAAGCKPSASGCALPTGACASQTGSGVCLHSRV